MTKLPKQWVHWARKAGLRPNGAGRGVRAGYYLKGRGRHWRFNSEGDFECSCPTEHFDRWANSRGAGMHGIPYSEKEFLARVEELRELSANAR